MMIEAILVDHLKREVDGLEVLDIGCGNGEISAYFVERGATVSAVDITDQRRDPSAGFQFRLTDSERIPYPDAAFDVVLSHHVIEHVVDQRLHLREIKRVLRDGGVAYLATPNRSSPFMEGHVGNHKVLRFSAMAPLFRSAGFEATLFSAEVAGRPDEFFAEVRWARHFPSSLLRALARFFPSQMFILAPAGSRGSSS